MCFSQKGRKYSLRVPAGMSKSHQNRKRFCTPWWPSVGIERISVCPAFTSCRGGAKVRSWLLAAGTLRPLRCCPTRLDVGAERLRKRHVLALCGLDLEDTGDFEGRLLRVLH